MDIKFENNKGILTIDENDMYKLYSLFILMSCIKDEIINEGKRLDLENKIRFGNKFDRNIHEEAHREYVKLIENFITEFENKAEI